MRDCILAIDQGTTGTRAVVFDHSGSVVSTAYRELNQHYPNPGWVEHDPEEIWETVRETVQEATEDRTARIAAVGITNQRETTVCWSAETGLPAHPAIVWQCRRTAPQCESLREFSELFMQRAGLPLDPYFSGTKMAWLLKRLPEQAHETLLLGTVDTWLLWKLTGGETFATDPTNASRTLLYGLRTHAWDPELCDLVGVPCSLLPEVRPSMGGFGTVQCLEGLEGVPIAGVAGDQQAALFGQTCFEPGEYKNTYGTGCFLLMNTGKTPIHSAKGLLTTVGVGPAGDPCYVLEGAVFVAGAAIQWLRDEVGLLTTAAESEAAALAVPDNGGVYFVPAFVGLGAPHWDYKARGTLSGLTRGSNRNHIVRAALESMAYQSRDVLRAMQEESGQPPRPLAVDGGASANDFLMQFQADLLGVDVVRPAYVESTALGAAFLAGLGCGLWSDAHSLRDLHRIERRFRPALGANDRARLLQGWRKALRQAMLQ